MRIILSLAFCGGLFMSGLAQVADNVQEATRYRVCQDNITSIAESHDLTSVEVSQSEMRVLENKSSAQLQELGDETDGRYGWVRSGSQLEELGSRYGWVRSGSQLEELGSRYGWVRSGSQLEELGDENDGRYGWVR